MSGAGPLPGSLSLIFSADRAWGIGKDNRLLFRTPGDMAFFKEMTTGNVVVMGRKTLDSLPGGKPLPGRVNLVLTRDPSFSREGAKAAHSPEELFQLLRGPECTGKAVFVIGGEEIYRLLLPYCGAAYVTKWDAVAESDSRVPDLDNLPGWELAESSGPVTEKGITYRFCTYRQASPKPAL